MPLLSDCFDPRDRMERGVVPRPLLPQNCQAYLENFGKLWETHPLVKENVQEKKF